MANLCWALIRSWGLHSHRPEVFAFCPGEADYAAFDNKAIDEQLAKNLIDQANDLLKSIDE